MLKSPMNVMCNNFSKIKIFLFFFEKVLNIQIFKTSLVGAFLYRVSSKECGILRAGALVQNKLFRSN